MNDQLPPEPKPVRPWRRIFVAFALLVALLIVGGAVSSYLSGNRAAKDRADFEARLDATDPNWRLAELEAARETIPDEENSARVIASVHSLMPKNWPPNAVAERLQGLAPERALDDEQVALLERELNAVPGALGQARRIAEMPRGRHPLEWKFNPIMTLLEPQQHTRLTASLLNYDAMLLAHHGDIDGALRSCRACVNAGRSLGDEPLMISQLIRIACISVGCNAAERTLARGRASDAELAKLQQLLELESKHRTLHIASRGERASSYDLLSKLADGRIDTRQMRADFGMEQMPLWQRIFGMNVSQREPLICLKYMTAVVEATDLPEHEQGAAEAACDASSRKLGGDAVLTRMLAPAVSSMGKASRRKSASVRCLMALVAAERYRLKRGKWPESLAALAPEFLGEVPADPFDGKPLRYARLADGVMVYSVGVDGADNGGNLDRSRPNDPGVDLGFRLWDETARRQPPKPPAPAPAP